MAFGEVKTLTRSIFLTALIIIVLFLVSSYFLAVFLGPALFFFTPEGLNYSGLYVRGLPILLFNIVVFGVPVWLNVGMVFFFLCGVFAVCLVAAWRFRESLHEVIGKSFSRPIKELFNNCLFAMPLITGMTLTAVTAIQSFQEARGVPTGELPLPSNRFEALFNLSYVVLIEEIGFRVIPIGAFLIVYLFWAGRKNAAKLSLGQRLKLFFSAPLHPEKAKKMVGVRSVSDSGVGGGISLGEWVMIFFTSIIFGSAHYGGGYEIGMTTLALVAGLAMGLTYLLYGVQAPILLHWFFNYYSRAYILASELYTPVLIAFSLTYFVNIILGVLGWLAVILLGLRKTFRAITKRDKSQSTPLPQAS